MKDLTTKTYCLMLMGGHKVYVTANDFAMFKAAMKSGVKMVEIGGNLINTASLVIAAPASEIEKTSREKRGDWQCEYGEWHKKGEECAHGFFKKLTAK